MRFRFHAVSRGWIRRWNRTVVSLAQRGGAEVGQDLVDRTGGGRRQALDTRLLELLCRETPLLVDPLLELVLGRPKPEQSFIDSLSDKIKLFCTTYDPRSDGYYFDYSFFVEIFVGISVIFFIVTFMRRELRKGKKSSDG